MTLFSQIGNVVELSNMGKISIPVTLSPSIYFLGLTVSQTEVSAEERGPQFRDGLLSETGSRFWVPPTVSPFQT